MLVRYIPCLMWGGIKPKTSEGLEGEELSIEWLSFYLVTVYKIWVRWATHRQITSGKNSELAVTSTLWRVFLSRHIKTAAASWEKEKVVKNNGLLWHKYLRLLFGSWLVQMVFRSLAIWQILSGLSQPQQPWIGPWLVHDPFPPNSFQFIIHLPSHNCML